ncbi:hypothetical protein MMG03_002842 [Fibrobacter succinogenes]|nr:hypothetical protein [Fibrobacter succinogenes]
MCNCSKMIAICGLNCETCDAYIATKNNDDELRAQTAKKWAEMNNAPEITPETINCAGCRGNGVKFYFCSHLCPIRKCCTEKGLEHCGQCAEMDRCETVQMIHGNNADAKSNLCGLKKNLK